MLAPVSPPRLSFREGRGRNDRMRRPAAAVAVVALLLAMLALPASAGPIEDMAGYWTVWTVFFSRLLYSTGC